MLSVEGLPAVVEGSRQSTMKQCVHHGKKKRPRFSLHEDTRGQWTSVGQLHGSQLFGVLWVKCTRRRMPLPSPNHPRRRKPTPRRLRHQLGWVLPRQTPPAEIGRLAPFALEIEGFLFCTRLGCWHGANEPRCQGRGSRFEVAGGQPSQRKTAPGVRQLRHQPHCLGGKSPDEHHQPSTSMLHSRQDKNPSRLSPYSGSVHQRHPTSRPVLLVLDGSPLPLFGVCCSVGQSSWKHHLVLPEVHQLRRNAVTREMERVLVSVRFNAPRQWKSCDDVKP